MLRAYLSHPIRGKKGKDATPGDIAANNQAAIQFADTVRWRFPALDLYVPAEHDEALTIFLHKGYITIDQLLEADCEVLAKRDFLLVYTPTSLISSGMFREMQFAVIHNIPFCILPAASRPWMRLLGHFIEVNFLKG